MRNIEWTAAQSVHVPELDAEHQSLFDLCDQFQHAVDANAPLPQLRLLLNELVAHAAGHFAHEEREMRAAAYSHYAWHRRQHQAARAKITLLEPRIRSGDREAARELLEFLSVWLKDHIAIADRMLGAHLRNRARAVDS